MPKISIIIPVFNVENYMDKCFDSLYLQTLKEIEIICINDCSTDNSLKKLLNYQLRDSRIKIIDLKKNKGAAYARNQGLKIANGEYLGFVDPDDSVDTDFYEKLYKEAKNGNYDIVKAERKTYELNGVINISKLNKKVNKDKFEFSCEWQTAIYKNEFVKINNINFPNECRKSQDIVFLFKSIIMTDNIKTINSTFYNYYKREESLDSKQISIKSAKSAMKAILIIIKELNKIKIKERKYINIYIKYLDIIFYTYRQNSTKEAIKLYANTFKSAYFNCKFKDMLKKYFRNNNLINYVIEKKHKQLQEYMLSEQFNQELNTFKINNLTEKILSIKNSRDKKYKIIYILFIKIKIKKKSHCQL